jgi:putative intracellular protease/amidase
MTSENAFDTPTNTDAVDGEVVLRGPDGVALSMTPEAAEETGRRLIEAAAWARRQRDSAAGA